jgi:hypothetical protein
VRPPGGGLREPSRTAPGARRTLPREPARGRGRGAPQGRWPCWRPWRAVSGSCGAAAGGSAVGAQPERGSTITSDAPPRHADGEHPLCPFGASPPREKERPLNLKPVPSGTAKPLPRGSSRRSRVRGFYGNAARRHANRQEHPSPARCQPERHVIAARAPVSTTIRRSAILPSHRTPPSAPPGHLPRGRRNAARPLARRKPPLPARTQRPSTPTAPSEEFPAKPGEGVLRRRRAMARQSAGEPARRQPERRTAWEQGFASPSARPQTVATALSGTRTGASATAGASRPSTRA